MAVAKKLRTYVHLQDSNGDKIVFGPDDKVPAWAAKQITNPKCWADNPVESDLDNGGGGGAD